MLHTAQSVYKLTIRFRVCEREVGIADLSLIIGHDEIADELEIVLQLYRPFLDLSWGIIKCHGLMVFVRSGFLMALFTLAL